MENYERFERKAKELRKSVLELAMEKKEAHLGGSFSIIELMVSLYDKMKPEDKLILSKGHCCFPQYVLLREKGYDPKIITHPDIDLENGICCTTGSLGHGMPLGAGMALARKLQNLEGNIYVLMGDGECQEGTTWETMPLAANYKLDNLTIIVDHNKLQALDKIEKISPLNLTDAFRTFGGDVREIYGHSFKEIIHALEERVYEKPKIIIAHTTKGKGVSYMEHDPKWHTRLPTDSELKQAYEELK